MLEDKDLVLIFSISGCRFAIGINDLVEVKESATLLSQSTNDAVLGTIGFRGGSIPLLDIKKRLGLPQGQMAAAGSVVVRVGVHILAFPVDAVEGVMNVGADPIKFPDVMLKEKDVLPFVYIRGDKFVFSLNVSALFDSDSIALLNDDINEEEKEEALSKPQ